MSHPSNDSSNAADIDDERSLVESHHKTDEKNVESYDETESYKYEYGDETESSQSDCDSDEELDLDQYNIILLHYAADRGDTEDVRSLLTTSVDVDVRNKLFKETPLHVATRNGHIDIVDLLLRKNANVNSRNALGMTPLYLAAKYNHIEIAKMLLKNNADIHATDRSNRTPYDTKLMKRTIDQLHLAVDRGDTEVVGSLLTSSVDVDVLDSWYKETPLHVATQNGHIDIVDLLLKKNANLNSRNERGETPLYLAAEYNQIEIAQMLLKNNAHIHVTDHSNKTPYNIAKENGHCEIVQLLMSTIKYPSLHIAASCGNAVDVRQILLNSDANPNVRNLDRDAPLHLASENGHLEIVEVLLGNNADANICNASGKNSFHIAAEHGYVEIVKSMINHGGKVDATDSNGDTPLHLASVNGHLEIVEVLLRNNADANIRNPSGKNCLHKASEHGYVEIVKSIIDHGGEVDAIDNNGDAPLHLASENGHLEVVEALLRDKATSNIRSDSGKTPLRIAAELDCAEIVKSMIVHGGEINAIDRNGDTALHVAASNRNSAVTNVLLNPTTERDSQIVPKPVVNQVSADEFEPSQHPIKNTNEIDQILNQIAAKDVEIANCQLSRSPTVNVVFKGQAAPLHPSVEPKYAELLENLIFSGANVNACNKAKMTPLHLACQNGHLSIVEILLDNHAVVDATKQSTRTPFYLAAENGHADILDVLMHRGVCDFVLTDRGKTPLHVFVDNEHTKVVEIIMKHSCRTSGKLVKDGRGLQETDKNLVELRGVFPAEFHIHDGRRVSAEIVWREKNTPLVIRRDMHDRTALDLAVSSVKPEMVRLLLSGDQCAYSAQDLRNSFEAMMAATDSERLLKKYPGDPKQYMIDLREIAEVLINSSTFNANQRNTIRHKYDTLLHSNMRRCRCSSDLITELVEKKYSKIDMMNVSGNLVSRHIETGMSNVKWSKWRHLQIQVRNHMLELLLVKGADFNMKNFYGETPLIIAVKNGCFHSIQILFDWEQKSGMKLDLDARDQFGSTALIKAAEMNHVSLVRMLINHGASVNLQNYYGLTALHSSIYEPNYYWFDFHFFCNGLREGEIHDDVDFEISCIEKHSWRDMPIFTITVVDIKKTIGQIQNYLAYDETNTQYKEEVIKLLLGDDRTIVDIEDFGGNTSLDLAVKFSKRITSATLEALRSRSTIRNKAVLEDEEPVEVGMVDERGRNPLHRLIISLNSRKTIQIRPDIEKQHDEHRFDVIIYGILLRPEKFTESAASIDGKGRMPLHYAAMLSDKLASLFDELLAVLLELGSNVNAADIYGKTPLHYAANCRPEHYELLVRQGADENVKDIYGYTPKDLKRVRGLMVVNNRVDVNLSTRMLISGWLVHMHTTEVFRIDHVTELSNNKVVETIRILSQSSSSDLQGPEKEIWSIWTKNEHIRVNRRISHLKPYMQHFFERLANGIKERDWRFECQPILVGSADEETKALISENFDYNFKLIKFSQLCDPFSHPLGPNGYFELRRKTNEDTRILSDDQFACFFNSDQCLLTNEVNFRFQIIVEEVLRHHNFWHDEHLFELKVEDITENRCEKPAGLCKTLKLIMINPIDDGETGLICDDISIDIAACIHVNDWWPDVPLPVGICPAVKLNGCIFVFDRPRFENSNTLNIDFVFSDTFAKISFAPAESRIIKESPTVIKAAYIFCKQYWGIPTYQLKTSLFFCLEALFVRNESEARNEDEISSEQLAFWVERILFCLTEFNRHDVFPCYFMPLFKQQTDQNNRYRTMECRPNFGKDIKEKDTNIIIKYSRFYDMYLDLCPDDAAIDIPIVLTDFYERRFYANYGPNFDEFYREELIRKLSSRICPNRPN